MTVLVDTNILIRSAQPAHPMHPAAVESVAALRKRNETICLVPQNLYEFWVVATRPVGDNGLGLDTAKVETELIKLRTLCTLLNDAPELLEQWQRLVVKYQVRGKLGHDARLVAAMLLHKVPTLLTFNKTDFQRFTEIATVSPDEIIQTA